MARGSDVAPALEAKTRKASGATSGSDSRKLSGPWGASFDGKGTHGLTFERRWTRPGVHPYDEIDWELSSRVVGMYDRLADDADALTLLGNVFVPSHRDGVFGPLE